MHQVAEVNKGSAPGPVIVPLDSSSSPPTTTLTFSFSDSFSPTTWGVDDPGTDSDSGSGLDDGSGFENVAPTESPTPDPTFSFNDSSTDTSSGLGSGSSDEPDDELDDGTDTDFGFTTNTPTDSPTETPTETSTESPTIAPTNAPTFDISDASKPIIAAVFSFDVPLDTAMSVVFQDSLAYSLEDSTGIAKEEITITVEVIRRAVAVTATMQAQSTAQAASVSSSVSSATSSGALTTSLNSHLASSGYTGAAIPPPTVAVTVGSTSADSEADNALLYGLLAGAGVLLVGGVAAALFVYRMKVQGSQMEADLEEEPLSPSKRPPLYDNISKRLEENGMVIEFSGMFEKHEREHTLRTSMNEMDTTDFMSENVHLDFDGAGVAVCSDDCDQNAYSPMHSKGGNDFSNIVI